MANYKHCFFAAILFIILCSSSIHVSVAARNLLQTTVPSLPKPGTTLPPFPPLPTLPQPTLPNLPIPTGGGSTQTQLPPLPNFPIPRVTLPPIPNFPSVLPNNFPTILPSFPFFPPPPAARKP
ncbi:hypothetical protein C1H46_008633 [Malus baccata]|uniref:Uncharacterized protein n=1 Tax=Malus baccata TaxID=106549 RepID=A0A540N3U2_MALBA|nr:hypothetical protein C1H46_008633 [Malus baccata]